MSIFYKNPKSGKANQKSGYVDGLRIFLNIKKQNFPRSVGLVVNPEAPRLGRLPTYPAQAVAALEALVNARAIRAEAADSTMAERYQLARDYCGMSDSAVARKVGVSRELARRWGAGMHRPSCMEKLATLFNVPVNWLADGGEENLPANSHIGVRVGAEEHHWREEMYSLTLPVFAELADDASVAEAQAYIEHAVMTRPVLSQAARRAGGRWQSVGSTLLFSPWIPVPEQSLRRRMWTDEVEEIIEDELATKPSVYGAWQALRSRCEALGLSSVEYPKLISLHKRIEKERLRMDKYGVDLNAMVAESLVHHPQFH